MTTHGAGGRIRSPFSQTSNVEGMRTTQNTATCILSYTFIANWAVSHFYQMNPI
jgi:hypothetical protein